jgi:hypothetical protein
MLLKLNIMRCRTLGVDSAVEPSVGVNTLTLSGDEELHSSSYAIRALSKRSILGAPRSTDRPPLSGPVGMLV